MENYEVGGVIVGFSNKLMHPVLMQIEESQLEQIEELDSLANLPTWDRLRN
jgi:hypothetical protein